MLIFINENILIDGKEWIPSNSAEIETNINELLRSLNCFNYHIEPHVYFSGNGIKNLIENFNLLNSYSDYLLTNPIDQLRILLEDIDAIDWDFEKIQKSDHNYYFMTGAGAGSYPVKNTSIAEAAEYAHRHNTVCLLNFTSSEFNESNPIYVSRSSISPPSNIETLSLSIIITKEETIDFIKKFRKKRAYNWNPKHGEFGKGMIANKGEVVSPLECGRHEAEKLLEFAVNSRNTDELYAYDKVNKKFIVFKNEYTNQNSYHSYHPINQDEIEDNVKNFLLND